MLKKTYKILKYIYKNPNISKPELEKKFSDFEKYTGCISAYVTKTDKNVNHLDKFVEEAQKLGLTNGELNQYVSEHMASVQDADDDLLILYSTNLKFDEYHEKKKHDTWLFWFPYTITTLIAIIAILAQILG